MKTFSHPWALAVLVAMGSLSAQADCTQTLSVGANVVSAVSSAAAGSVICLNSGNYGSLSFSAVSKTSDVTLQSALGVSATASIDVGNGSNHIKFRSLTIDGMTIEGSTTKNITVSDSTFLQKIYVNTTGFNNNNILIDHNIFDAINSNGGVEGRISISWPGGPGTAVSGVVITNNHIGKLGCSDGVQVGSYGVVIGPGNVFDDSSQGSCTEHVDSIQLYGQSHTTITGNYFVNVHVCIGGYDGGNSETITNNVFIASSAERNCVIDLGSITNLNFSHNTVFNAAMRVGAINQTGATTGLIQNNIFLQNSWSEPGAGFSGTTSSNLFSNTTSKGLSALMGTVQFINGGMPPSTWAGFQLAAGSIGAKAATDQKDMGVGFYGTALSTSSLAAPKNLRVLGN